MKVESSAFLNGSRIPEKYTADGENINSGLVVSEIPDGVKSLVLVVDDPDAKRICGFSWIHWVVFDVRSQGFLQTSFKIEENSVPGILGKNSFGGKDYGGPSPPAGSGIHHYNFRVYALNKKLGLPEMSTLDKIKKAMNGCVVDEAVLVGVYWRD